MTLKNVQRRDKTALYGHVKHFFNSEKKLIVLRATSKKTARDAYRVFVFFVFERSRVNRAAICDRETRLICGFFRDGVIAIRILTLDVFQGRGNAKSKDQTDMVFQKLDINQDGVITFEEFIESCLKVNHCPVFCRWKWVARQRWPMLIGGRGRR